MSNPDQLIRELRDTLDEARSYVGGPQFSPSMDSECADAVHKATAWLDSRPTEAAAMAATVPAGYALVPQVLTKEMLYEVQENAHILPPRAHRIWKMLLAAAPQAPVADQPAEPSPAAKMGTWCLYVAGMICAYLKEDADGSKAKAIAGIIERRLKFAPKGSAPLQDAQIKTILSQALGGEAVRVPPGWKAVVKAVESAHGIEAANCERCQGSGEDPEGFYDQSRGPDGATHDGPCRDCSGSGAAPKGDSNG